MYTIPVAAVDQNGKPASGSESCSAIMTSAYSVDLVSNIFVVIIDRFEN
jgi:hypothetical protein